MNPYKNINSKTGLLRNENSPYNGRYRLEFNQVFPFRELTFGRTFIKVSNSINIVKGIYETFPQHLKDLIHLYQQKNVRDLEIDCFEEDDWFLCFDMAGDVIHFPTYNVYFALKNLSNYLENCHFFMYSQGDLDDRWLDEYTIINGSLLLSRDMMEFESFFGTCIYYLKRAIKLNTFEFKKFAAFHLYDLLFENKYTYDTLTKAEDGTIYNEYGEKIIIDDIQEYIEMMSAKEFNVINRSLRALFGINLQDNKLKEQINNIFSFDTLDWRCVSKK